MLRPRLRWLFLIPLGILLLPALVWGLVITIAPTGWAREKIVAQVSEATGRTVRLRSLRVGVLGAVRLVDLEIGAPRSHDDPWLKVAGAEIDVNLIQLMRGTATPSRIQVEGAVVRVLRRKDGTLELNDLLQKSSPAASPAPRQEPTPAPASHGDPTAPELPGLDVVLKDATITVIDEPTQTRLEFTGVKGQASWSGRRAAVHKLEGTLNGGPFELAAQLDLGGALPEFEADLRARDVSLSEGMSALGYVVPVVAGNPGNIDGKLAVNFSVRGKGWTMALIQPSLIGQGSISLDPIQLDGSKMLADLARIVDLPPKGRVGSVKTDFVIKDGRISTDDLTLNVAKIPLVLAGWTDFNGKLDYRLKSENLSRKLPGKARDLLSELKIDLNDLTSLKVQGSVDALVVTLDGVPVSGGPRPEGRAVPKIDDKQRAKELARKLRDKFLR